MTDSLTPADIDTIQRAAIRDQYEAREALVAEFVASQNLGLSTVTTEAVYDLAKPVRMVGEHTDQRLDSVRVRMTRYPTSTDEEDREGYIEVEGYLRPLNQTGALRANGVATWRRLPERLAAPLIVRALTEGPPPAPPTRVQKPPPPK